MTQQCGLTEEARDVKALAISGYGLDNAAVAEFDDPIPGPGEVLVRVRAAALNRLDLWTAGGALKIEHEFPHILGADAAGDIEALGEGVQAPQPGTKVVVNPALSCGACEFCRSGEQSMCTTFRMLGEHVPGTLAERIVVPATNVFPLPQHFSFTEGAALGVTFITAHRMLFTRGRLVPGEWVLVTGIGGGLALSLFQLARPIAGKVFVTSSSQAKLDRALEIGADGGVDYSRDDVGKSVRKLTYKRGVDLVVDSAGGTALEAAMRALRKGGRMVVAGATAGARAEIDVRRLFWNQVAIIGSTMGSDGDVSDMLRNVAGSSIRPVIDRSFVLSEAVDALRYLDSGDQFGKVVVEMS
jgi:NADPH:quinone reductase-like Zn-dependent oxidoreductase